MIRDLGWPLNPAHPGYVARMKHNPDKTDYRDAKMLAELSRAGLIPPVWLPPRCVRELRLLVRLRADLVGHLRSVKTRLLAVLRQQRIAEPRGVGRWCRKWLAWLVGAECGLSEPGRRRQEVSQLADCGSASSERDILSGSRTPP